MKWKLVPVEPTEAMSLSAERDLSIPRVRVNSFKHDRTHTAHIGYHAMLAAAPKASEDEALVDLITHAFMDEERRQMNAYGDGLMDCDEMARAVLKMLEGEP